MLKKPALSHCQLIVKQSPIHGYGVFADEEIPEGKVIEECYVLYPKEYSQSLADFYFLHEKIQAIPLGLGCIYNHSDQHNANYEINDNLCMVVYANKPIKKGEEIFISYGSNWWSTRKLLPRFSRLYRIKKQLSAMSFILRFGIIVSFLVLSIQSIKWVI